jgi:hypothetical protein
MPLAKIYRVLRHAFPYANHSRRNFEPETSFFPIILHPAAATGFAVFFRESATDIVYAPQATLRKNHIHPNTNLAERSKHHEKRHQPLTPSSGCWLKEI